MIYKPRRTFSMWDTWLYYHKGYFYLYYLTMGPTERQGWHGQGIAMAVSRDGVHWQETGTVLEKDDNATGMGTGSIWKAADFEKSGRFIMNYSTWSDWCIQSQHIRFAESTDLIHWTKTGEADAFYPDPGWYKTYPAQTDARWDCIYTIDRPGGGRYGYWTAAPKDRPGCGFGESANGLRWTALEPPVFEGCSQAEVGAVEMIGDKFYMLYHGGRQTLAAETAAGPFQPVKRNPVLLGGNAYFARYLPTPDGLLVNHHSISRGNSVADGMCRMAPLKRGVVGEDGALRLVYWEGNDGLIGEPTNFDRECRDDPPLVSIAGSSGGFIIKGLLRPTTRFGPENDQTISEQTRCRRDGSLDGLYIEYERDRGMYIALDANGRSETGLTDNQHSYFKREGDIQRHVDLSDPSPFCLMVSTTFVELYVCDILIWICSMPGPWTGRARTLGETSGSTMDSWQAWRFG